MSSPKVFVSYSHKDRKYVDGLTKRLQENGVNVWYDPKIVPGGGWSKEIENQIRESRAFILVLSPDSSESDGVRKEIHLAQEAHRPIIPVMFRDTRLPYPVADLQWIDGRKSKDPVPALLSSLNGTPIPPVNNKQRVSIPLGVVALLGIFGVVLMVALIAYVAQFKRQQDLDYLFQAQARVQEIDKKINNSDSFVEKRYTANSDILYLSQGKQIARDILDTNKLPVARQFYVSDEMIAMDKFTCVDRYCEKIRTYFDSKTEYLRDSFTNSGQLIKKEHRENGQWVQIANYFISPLPPVFIYR